MQVSDKTQNCDRGCCRVVWPDGSRCVRGVTGLARCASGRTPAWRGCTGWYRWPTGAMARHASPSGGRDPSPSPSLSRTWNLASPRPSSSTSATATRRSGTKSPSTLSTPNSFRQGGPTTVPSLVRRLAHLAGVLDSIPCESPHVVIGNLLTLRPVEMTGWRETLRYPQNLARNTAKVERGGGAPRGRPGAPLTTPSCPTLT